IARRLNREQGTTIVAITHFMHEALDASRVIIMQEGRIAMQGTPREVFAQGDRLRALQLDLPRVSQIAQGLHARVADFPPNLLTPQEIVEAIRARMPAQVPENAPQHAPDSAATDVLTELHAGGESV